MQEYSLYIIKRNIHKRKTIANLKYYNTLMPNNSLNMIFILRVYNIICNMQYVHRWLLEFT